MTDPRFYENKGPFVLKILAEITGSILQGKDDQEIEDVNTFDRATKKDLIFYDAKRLTQGLNETSAGACLITPEAVKGAPSHLALLINPNPYTAFAQIARRFYPNVDRTPFTQSEHIHPTAKIADDVIIGPGTVIGSGVEIAAGVQLGANVVIEHGVKIGEKSTIQSGCYLSYCILGRNVHIFPGVCIGQPGFGFLMEAGQPVDMPQLGRVLVEDNVMIGANSTLDRGSLKDTVIGAGTRIDNLVQIAHGVHIGKGCIIVAQTGIAGSTQIGDFAAMGGQVGITEHLYIGKGARIAAQSGVMRNVPDGQTVGGSPAVPIKEWRKQCVRLNHLAKQKLK